MNKDSQSFNGVQSVWMENTNFGTVDRAVGVHTISSILFGRGEIDDVEIGQAYLYWCHGQPFVNCYSAFPPRGNGSLWGSV